MEFVRTRRVFLVLLTVALALSPSHAPAAAEAPQVDVAAPRSALLAGLDALASFADSQRLFRFRDRVFALILRLAPDNPRARVGLKYRRDPKTKAWLQSPEYREPLDWARDALPKAEARLGVLLAGYRDAVLLALSSVPDLPDAVKDEHLDDLATLLPDDRQVHELRGDVLSVGRWLMAETVTATAERGLFHEAMAAAQHRARASIHAAAKLPAFFEGEGFEVGDPAHAVFGWTGDTWARESLQFIVVGAALSAVVLRSDDVLVAGPRETLLFPNQEVATAWMRRNPKRASTEDMRNAPAVGGMSIEDGTEVVYFGHEPFRRTAALSATVYNAILRTCPAGTEERAWILYGLGNRIMGYVTRLRVAQSISLEGTERLQEASEEATLPEEIDAWRSAAAGVLADRGAERLARVLTIKLNAMKPSDLLVAYGLAAYLREGRPDAFDGFLAASRSSSDAAQVVQEGLKTDLSALARRLRRWLLEQSE